jgi:large subunit ribosomal protein L13e
MRGFSIGEIQKAGATVAETRKTGIRVDKRRRSAHEANVKELKKLRGQLAKEKKQKPKGV